MSNLQKLLTSFCVTAALTLFLWFPPAWAEPVNRSLLTSQETFQAGVTAFQNENYQLAAEAFTQAIEQQPNFVSAYSNRCLTYLILNKYRQAIADCTRGLQIDPTNAESYLNRGLAYYRLGEYQNAVTDYNQLLQLQPSDYRAYYNRGLAQVELGAKVAAISDYNQSIQYSSTLPAAQLAEIFNDRGVVYLQLKEPKKAIADFTQAIHLNADDARSYFNRACACHHAGDYLAALSDFDRVLALNPNHAQTYFNRGMMHHQMGKIVDAIADLQQAAQCFHEQGETIAYQNTLHILDQMQTAPSEFA